MSLSDKYLAKAWPAVTKLVTLGLVDIAYRWGHRWVVLAISVKLPFTS